jgi:integrase
LRKGSDLFYSRPSALVRRSAATPNGHLCAPSNTSGDLRQALDRAGLPWVTSHTFCKTVATRLDDAGLSARQIADHLGHSRPSLTRDVYLGRGTGSPRTAAAIRQAL